MIAVLISGGLDSLMAAALLRQQGHEVVGLYLQLGYNELTTRQLDQLAGQLEIPVETVDCRRLFKSEIVDYFTRAYLNGETPNPCLPCNPRIKFEAGWQYARKIGARRIASGHYCQILPTRRGPGLWKGVDPHKEQSYFLAFLSRQQLSAALFPVGHLTKAAVRRLARERSLEPVTRQESQDICFIHPGDDYAGFIRKTTGQTGEPGLIEDMQGRIIGEHNGIHLFTVGQRRGINCPAARPYYVAAIDAWRNRIRVGFKEDLLARGCSLRQVNWIGGPGGPPRAVRVKVRYRQAAVPAIVRPIGPDKAEVSFVRPQFGLSPGQGAVFYEYDQVAGGGIIQNRLGPE